MKNERNFWTSLMEQANPGWTLHIASDSRPGAIGLGELDAYLYAIDTSTGWTAAAAFRSENMRRGRQGGAAKRDWQSIASAKIIECGSQSRPPDAPETETALKAAGLALAQTRTYEVVAADGKLSGHWLYFVYRARNGQAISRPAFLRNQRNGFIPPSELAELRRTIVAQDTRGGSSHVASEIARAGGAILAA
jgi:hypothetical protein